MPQIPTLVNIPTNIITGFLGVGKTTAIQHLLNQKPKSERWAVLVNEFGEVGIDASLVSGHHAEESGVYLREVPGGCMCCASGLPMQIALNMLLAKSKPDRLLIEPTGLGHPKEVLSVLNGPFYREVLDVRATITLVDVRKLTDTRYLDNAIFRQQLAIADVLVGNKADLYQPQDIDSFDAFLRSQAELADVPRFTVEHGRLELDWLDRPCAQRSVGVMTSEVGAQDASAKGFVTTTFAPVIPACGYLRINNHGQGFHSSGWLFVADYIFDDAALYSVLLGVEAVRLKGVFITSEGIVGYNKVDDVLTRVELDDSSDSRVEIISSSTSGMEALEQALLKCLTNPRPEVHLLLEHN
jgi:G3E family GTPase